MQIEAAATQIMTYYTRFINDSSAFANNALLPSALFDCGLPSNSDVCRPATGTDPVLRLSVQVGFNTGY